MRRRVDLTGERYGRLQVIGPSETRIRNRTCHECLCECGTRVTVTTDFLRSGHRRSCGCLQQEVSLKGTHGFARRIVPTRPEYRAYQGAKARCNNPRASSFENYGGRGIEFRFTSFQQFLDELGPRPEGDYSLDRIDSDGHYEPGNVRWATKSLQSFNKRAWNKSGIKGVAFDRKCPHRPWQARIGVNGRRRYLGHFATADEAARAIETAAREAFARHDRVQQVMEQVRSIAER